MLELQLSHEELTDPQVYDRLQRLLKALHQHRGVHGDLKAGSPSQIYTAKRRAPARRPWTEARYRRWLQSIEKQEDKAIWIKILNAIESTQVISQNDLKRRLKIKSQALGGQIGSLRRWSQYRGVSYEVPFRVEQNGKDKIYHWTLGAEASAPKS